MEPPGIPGRFIDAIRSKLASRNVALFVSAESAEQIGNDVTRVLLRIDFACGDTGATHTVRFFGDGLDKGDKGLYKAYTGAIKYLLMKTFLIPTGDDPEIAGEADRRELASNVRTGRVSDGKQPQRVAAELPMRAMTVEEAEHFRIPLGDFKGALLGEVYREHTQKMHDAAAWARSRNRFADFVAGVEALYRQRRSVLDAAA